MTHEMTQKYKLSSSTDSKLSYTEKLENKKGSAQFSYFIHTFGAKTLK